jgi:hypothetical protein
MLRVAASLTILPHHLPRSWSRCSIIFRARVSAARPAGKDASFRFEHFAFGETRAITSPGRSLLDLRVSRLFNQCEGGWPGRHSLTKRRVYVVLPAAPASCLRRRRLGSYPHPNSRRAAALGPAEGHADRQRAGGGRVGCARRVQKATPPTIASLHSNAHYRLEDELRLLESETQELMRQLKSGESLGATQPIYDRIGSLARDARENARKQLVTEPVQKRVDHAEELWAQLTPYYTNGPAPSEE